MGAVAIGVPGWPELAFCTASTDNTLTVSMHNCSRSLAVAAAGSFAKIVVGITIDLLHPVKLNFYAASAVGLKGQGARFLHRAMVMSYQPIENYGVIGNLHTIALVGLNGSIDFLCFPQFDSPSIFARLLDDKKGGFFCINPVFSEMKQKQLYLPDTNVLLTRFLSPDGVGEITDLMPVGGQDERRLIRRITTVRGEVKYQLHCSPRFNYGRDIHQARQTSPNEITFHGDGPNGPSIRLKAGVPLQISDNDATATFTLAAGDSTDFIIENADNENISPEALKQLVTGYLIDTINYWKAWIGNSTYQGRWREIVNRSALVLKLLSSIQYGSIIAAPTFSLPETIGGKRNWDYRYTWIRDASFTVYAFIRLGYSKEAGAFMGWIEKVCRGIKADDRLGIMYSIDGNRQLEEHTLDHFEGYKGSAPVRIGNDAYAQLQLDIYGELMDSVYLYNKYGEPIPYDFWKDLEKQIEWLSRNWDQPDDGIWEVRGGKQKFLFSRLACWVALDRAMKIAEARSFPATATGRNNAIKYTTASSRTSGTRKNKPSCNIRAPKRWMPAAS